MRIVYDASARANDKSPSLNECLDTGPPLQNQLWSVLVRNRFHPVAIAGDLKQAFLQVRIRQTDRDTFTQVCVARLVFVFFSFSFSSSTIFSFTSENGCQPFLFSKLALPYRCHGNFRIALYTEICTLLPFYAFVVDQSESRYFAEYMIIIIINYPNVIRPIIEKLPHFIRSKWEKEIVRYADNHQDKCPGFHAFATMVYNLAKSKNHPNVVASGVLNADLQKTRVERTLRRKTPYKPEPDITRRILKTDTSSREKKQCPFHQIKGIIYLTDVSGLAPSSE